MPNTEARQDQQREMHIAANRTRRALALKAVLRAHEVSATDASVLSDAGWKAYDTLAAIKGNSSPATRAITLVLMQAEEV